MRADGREGGGLSHRQQPSDQPHMGTAVRTAKTSPASWDAFRDIEAFVDEVLAELAAMAADGTRPTRHRAEAAIGRSGAAQGDYGDLVCGVLRHAASDSSATSRSTRCTRSLPAGPGSGYGAGCSTGCAAPGGWPAVTPPSQGPS